MPHGYAVQELLCGGGNAVPEGRTGHKDLKGGQGD
jgi:hypothetical protein